MKYNINAKGQQLSEYALALALIAVALIATVGMFGNNISGAINSMTSGMNAPPPGNVNTPDSGSLSLQKDASGNVTVGLQASSQTFNGITSLSEAIETAGANGTTTEVLGLLDKYIKSALASGKITETGANQLMALSKKGYDIANIEAVIDDMVQNNPQALNRPFTYNGQTYPRAADVVKLIGFHPGDKTYDVEANAFVALYNKAAENGALKNKEAHETVTLLYNHVLDIANGAEAAAIKVTNDEIRPSEYISQVIGSLGERDKSFGTSTAQTIDTTVVQDTGVSKTTEGKSKTICEVGGPNCERQ